MITWDNHATSFVVVLSYDHPKAASSQPNNQWPFSTGNPRSCPKGNHQPQPSNDQFPCLASGYFVTPDPRPDGFPGLHSMRESTSPDGSTVKANESNQACLQCHALIASQLRQQRIIRQIAAAAFVYDCPTPHTTGISFFCRSLAVQ